MSDTPVEEVPVEPAPPEIPASVPDPDGSPSTPDGWHVAPPTEDVRAEGSVAGLSTEDDESTPDD